jgi:hypothetical protein
MISTRNVLALICAVWFCTGICAAQQAPRKVTVSQVLSWLPADTEAVIGATGPFSFPDPAAIAATPSGELSAAELAVRAQFNLPLFLFRLKNGGLRESLKDKKVDLAIEGSRHFRPAAALGAPRFEGCGIVVLERGTQVDGGSFMKTAVPSAKALDTIAGVPVAVFQEQSEGDVWTTLVAVPRNDVVLVATDLAYLRTVLARLRGTPGPRALPDSLPEWKYSGTRAPVWGIRHYDRSQAPLDPTSPLRDRNPADFSDSRAVGLAFYFEPFDRKQAIVSYLSASEYSRGILQAYLGMADADAVSRGEFRIRFGQPAPSALQGLVSLSPAEALYRLLFGLAAMLGHATLV